MKFVALSLLVCSALSTALLADDSCLRAIQRKSYERGAFQTLTKEAKEAELVLELIRGDQASLSAARKKIWAEHGILPTNEQIKVATAQALADGTFCTPEINIKDEVVHDLQQYNTAIVTVTEIIINSGVDTEEAWSCTASVQQRYKMGKVEISSGVVATREEAHRLFTESCERNARDSYACTALLTSDKKNACTTVGSDPQ